MSEANNPYGDGLSSGRIVTVLEKLLWRLYLRWGGITHYLSPLLDNIVRKGVDVVMVIPSVKDNQTIGKGVKLVNSEALYQVRYSEVKQGWYGKTILTDLKTILDEEKPDIVVLGWPYFLQYFFWSTITAIDKRE